MLNNCESGIIPHKSFTSNEIKIINLGDIHYGSHSCNRQFFEKVVKYINDNSDVYWLSTGDMLDVNSWKGKFYDPSGLEVNFEFECMIDILEPIANKCLGIVGSNHSDRIHKLSGLNLDQIVTKILNIPYLGGTGLINCVISSPSGNNAHRQSYYISMTHGKSNATTLGAKANSIFKFSEMFNGIDVCLEGHTHTFMVSKKDTNIIDKRHNKITPFTMTMCVCGHCLEWTKSYAAENKYQPTPIGFPELTLTSIKKNVDVRLLTPSNI